MGATADQMIRATADVLGLGSGTGRPAVGGSTVHPDGDSDGRNEP